MFKIISYIESFFTLLFLDKKKQLNEVISRTPYKLSMVSKNQGLLPQRPVTAHYGTPEELAWRLRQLPAYPFTLQDWCPLPEDQAPRCNTTV
ncbi:MAG: hypothetical protein LBQ60_15790 [Bacteroidales bacterium]|jgi:hypothetical protein|nr:hypothetical protein [Bacteroidales bacterium]